MLSDITLQCTFDFMDQLNNEFHENMYPTNIDENQFESTSPTVTYMCRKMNAKYSLI